METELERKASQSENVSALLWSHVVFKLPSIQPFKQPGSAPNRRSSVEKRSATLTPKLLTAFLLAEAPLEASAATNLHN